MSDLINNFLGLVNEAPQVSDELWEYGAYPVKTNDGWEVPVEKVKPVIDSYFARTRTLTGGNKAYSHEVPGYYLTNETQYPSVMSSVVNLRGAFIGAGALLSLTIPAWQDAEHAFVVDYNAGIPFVVTPLLGALFAMAPTRAQFVSLILGKPIKRELADQTLNMHGMQIADVIKSQSVNEEFSKQLKQNLAVMIGDGAQINKAHQHTYQWLNGLRKISQLFRLARQDYAGHGGPLVSEESYRRHRALFLDGRISGMAANYAEEEMLRIETALKAMNIPLESIYISNIESWLSTEEDPLEPISFYENLKRFGALGNPLVISSLYVRQPLVYDLQSYLRRAAPFSIPPDLASRTAMAFEVLRYYAMWKRAKSLSLEKVLKKIQERGFEDLVDRLMESVLNFDGTFPVNWNDMHDYLVARNKSYEHISWEVQNMFLFNLMDLEIVRTPYPVLYNAPPMVVKGSGGDVSNYGSPNGAINHFGTIGNGAALPSQTAPHYNSSNPLGPLSTGPGFPMAWRVLPNACHTRFPAASNLIGARNMIRPVPAFL